MNINDQTAAQLSIEDWLKSNATGITPRTAEWLEARRHKIGGSSLAAVQGTSPYENVQSLINSKLGLTAARPRLPMQWGVLFEPILRAHAEEEFECKIIGHDSFILGPPCTAYSPDGLAAVILDGEVRRALFEFKCPFMRKPSGEIPDYYVPQVKMGLDIISAADTAIFVEGVFRRCARGQYGPNPKYNSSLQKYSDLGDPILCGVIGFHAQAPIGGLAAEDIGLMPRKEFMELLDAVESGAVSVWYGPLRSPIECCSLLDDDITAYHSARGSQDVGTMCWKLFSADYHSIDREPNYLQPWLPRIAAIIDFVKKYDAADAVTRESMVALIGSV